jgi:formylglycine-generating enzyme required for sulfatase activity
MMKKIEMMLVAVVLLSVVNIISADTFVGAGGQGQFDIDFVTISGDTNPPTSGYGNVNGDYRMGKFEITNDQYAKFASNSNVYFTGADVPSNRVSWFEAAQFTNFLNTSTGNQAAYKFSGDVMGVWETTDTGYDASNPFRNSNAKYFMPTEDEWVKAAYWNGTSLQTYATKSGESLTQGDGTSGTGWNYYDFKCYDPGYATNPAGPWDVGSGSEELNGTFDMMGNVYEWMESNYSGDFNAGSGRGLRGGSCSSDSVNYLSSSNRSDIGPYYELDAVGFRVASNVPEPCSLVLLGLGGLVLRSRKK